MCKKKIAAMTFSRKKALDVVHDELVPVAEHISKIFVHAPSKWDKKWEGDIATFFPRVIAVANKVSQKSGKLDKKDLVERLNDCWLIAAADMRKFWRKPEFKELKKSSSEKDVEAKAAEFLLVELRQCSAAIAELILTDHRSMASSIAHVIVSATCRVRDNCFPDDGKHHCFTEFKGKQSL